MNTKNPMPRNAASKTSGNVVWASLLAALIAALLATPSATQEKRQESPGGYHGELDFPISWKQYYSYAEWTKIMHDIQAEYPHLSKIESIGQSRMGRDQYLITISARSTGADLEKPAMWVDGAVHGNEVNGISCSLYLMWHLLTRYDYDPYVHELVNRCTFYILPGLNVDANDSFVSHPNTPNNPREPYRPEDNDGDGLYDEDRTEDVDGDGELSTMYVEDPHGDYKLSPDKRRFVRVEHLAEDVLRFRRVGSEGYDNDGDGRINEDDIGGPDPNRNYPAGWSLRSGHPYPLSEPCTRNAFEFQLAHTNIFAGFHYHNTGRLIMFTTPPRKEAPAGEAYSRGSALSERSQQRLDQLRETNKYAQVFDIEVKSPYQEDLTALTEIVTMGARIMKNYRPVPTGGSGMAPSATYDMLGAYGILIELWGSPTFEADEDDDGRISDEEYLKWCDIELSGEGWILPHKCDHPDLGEVWIGGSRKKHTSRTPPARYIEMEALKNAQFVMYCASQFPRVEIDELSLKPVTDDLYWVNVVVKNDRIYPTVSDRALVLKRTKKDVLRFSASENITLVSPSKAQSLISPFNDSRERLLINKPETEFRLKGKEWLQFSALVKMDKGNGWVAFDVDSQHGGEDRKKIEIGRDD